MTEPYAVPYAGAVTRSLALFLDLALIAAAIAIVGTVLGVVASALSLGHLHVNAAVAAALLGVWWLIISAYLVSFWTLGGQTPGMRVMRLRVVRLDGRPLGLGQALVRGLGMVLAAIPLLAGYALILVDDRRQGLQDKLAGTTVLYVADEAELEPEPGYAATVTPRAPTRRYRRSARA